MNLVHSVSDCLCTRDVTKVRNILFWCETLEMQHICNKNTHIIRKCEFVCDHTISEELDVQPTSMTVLEILLWNQLAAPPSVCFCHIILTSKQNYRNVASICSVFFTLCH